ncbi:MAG TPA: EamA family transporter [Acholeplasmatales bacterium]|nr:EamA family transporter [Acholeplasmatales bacterium]
MMTLETDGAIMKKRENLTLILAFGATLIGASANALSKFALQDFSPIPLAFIRHVLTAVFFLSAAIFNKIRLPKLKDIPWFLLSGFSGYAAFSLFFNLGLETVDVSVASMIMGTFPIMTVILAAIVFKEKIAGWSYAAVAVEFVGIIIMFASKDFLNFNLGTALIFVSAFLLAVYNVTQKFLIKKYTPLEICVYSILACLLMMSFYAPQSIAELSAASAPSIWAVIILGIIVCGVGTLMWSAAVGRTKKLTTITNFSFLTPFLATLYGVLILSEIPTLRTLIGGIVIIFGSFLFQYFNRKKDISVTE